MSAKFNTFVVVFEQSDKSGFEIVRAFDSKADAEDLCQLLSANSFGTHQVHETLLESH